MSAWDEYQRALRSTTNTGGASYSNYRDPFDAWQRYRSEMLGREYEESEKERERREKERLRREKREAKKDPIAEAERRDQEAIATWGDDALGANKPQGIMAREMQLNREPIEQMAQWQKEHISPKTEQVKNGQSVADFDPEAARKKAESRIRYDQAYDEWNKENPEYKDKPVAEKYRLFAKELEIADASQGYKDFYNRNKKDTDFQRMSDDEKRRQYMMSLDSTLKEGGELPEDQRGELFEYKYNGLSDEEKKAVDRYIQAKDEETEDKHTSGLEAIKKTFTEGTNWRSENREAIKKEKQDAINELIRLGWDDNRIKSELDYYRKPYAFDDWYSRNQKDPDFQRMSDEEKQRQYMMYLENTAQETGTLPQAQRVELSQYKYDHLTDEERKAVDVIMAKETADTKEFGEYGLFGGMQSYDYSQKSGKMAKEAQDAEKTLKSLGWEDRDIERFKELADYNATQQLNDYYRIDPNASSQEKFLKSAENTAMGVYTAPGRGIGSLLSENGAYGKNLSSKYRYPVNMSSEAYRQVRENAIGNDHPIGQLAYSAGVSSAESLLTMHTLGGALGGAGVSATAGKALSLIPFAVNAYDSSYEDAVNRGFGEGQAQLYGLASGLIEAGTEVFSLDKMWDMASAKKIGRNLATSAAIQAGIEGSEEVVSELAGRFADYIAVEIGGTGKTQRQLDIEEYMQEHPYASSEEAANYAARKFAEQVGEAGLSGMISAIPDTAVSSAIGAYRSKYGNNLTEAVSDRYKNLNVEGDTAYENKLREDKAKYENNPTQYLADNYKVNSEEDARVKQGLEEIAEKERNGEKLSVSDKAFITKNVLDNREQFNQEYLDKLFDTGEDSVVPYKYREVKTEVTEDQARQMLAEAAKAGDAKAFIEAQRKTRNSTIEDVANRAEEIIDFYSGMAQEHGITKEDIGKALIAEKQAYMAGLRGEELDKNMLTTESQIAYNDGKMDAITQATRTIVDTQDALKTDVTTKSGNTVKLDGVFTSDGVMTDGGVVSLDNLELDENKATNKAYHFADNYQSVNVKNNFLNNIKDGQNIENYNTEYGKVYDSALAGLSLENVQKRAYTELDADQIKNIYETAVVERQARAADTLREALNGVKGAGKGKAYNESSSTDPKMLKIASMLARATKWDIHIVDENPFNEKARGSFHKEGNAVYVRADDFMRSLGHEFSHYVETYNKGEYDSLRNAVANYAASKMGSDEFMRAVKAYGKMYEGGADQQLSADDISGEMFNDIVPMILESKRGSKAFAKYLAENYGADEAMTFGEKIKEVMENLAGTIRNYLSNADHPTAYAKEMKKYADELGQFADDFIKALDGAIQNYNKGTQGESAGEGKVEYSLDVPDSYFLTDEDENDYIRSGGHLHLKRAKARDAGQNIIIKSIKELATNLRNIINTKNLDNISPFAVSRVSDDIIDQIYQVSNGQISAKDFFFQIQPKDFKHSYNEHHEAKYPEKGDLDMSVNDMIYVVAHLNDSDVVMTEDDRQGNKVIMSIDMPDGKMFIVEIVSKTDGALSLKNMWKMTEEGFDAYIKELRNSVDTMESKSPGAIPSHAVPSDLNIAHKEQNSKVKFSLSEDSTGRELSEGQKEYFADESDKLLDENGALKRYYHGTARKDRVGTVFRPERATSGPMAFFTDTKSIAENYAKDKDDTSLSRDERYDTYYTQFRLNIGGKDMSIGEAWKRLPASKKNEIMRKAEHVTWDDEAENIIYDPKNKNGNGSFTQYLLRDHKGNYLEALVDSWLDTGDLFGNEEEFLNILEMVGIDNAEYLNPDAREEGVYEVYIHSANPFDTTNISKKDLNALKKVSKTVIWNDADIQADMWDKNNVRPEKWISRLEDDIKNGTTHAWTSIPDWVTATLRSLGYDAISDLGGKGGGAGHQVVIPFESNQVKDVNNENPSKDPDIRFSIDADDDRIFYTRGTEVVKNATDDEYRQMREDILKERPWMRDMPGEPLLRHTYDEEGNVYYWDAAKGIHAFMEPEINKHFHTRTSQHYEWWKREDKDDYPIDYSTRYSIGGINAFMADTDSLDRARELEKEGKTRDEIWRETGWYKGADGNWKFEIDDDDAEVTNFEEFPYEKNKEYYLTDAIKHDALFKAYPTFNGVKFVITDLPGNMAGMYSHKKNTIYVDELNGIKAFGNVKETPQEALKSTLLHEMQHVIQRVSHFARGSSPAEWARRERGPVIYTKGDMTLYKDAVKRIQEYQKTMPEELVKGMKRLDWLSSLGEVRAMKDLMNELENKYGDKYEDYYDADFTVKFLQPDEYELTAYEAYEMTAGEIEAYEVENRLKLDKETRKQIAPTIDTHRGVLFAENMDKPWEKPARFSLSEDSEGRELTEGQQRYFNNSQNLDDEGRLLQMYHGTETGGFTVFDPAKSDDETSLFFTDNEDVAKSYVFNGSRDRIDVYKERKAFNKPVVDEAGIREVLEDRGYTNISFREDTFLNGTKVRYWDFTTPDGKEIKKFQNKDMLALANAERRGEQSGIYPVYLNVENPLKVDAQSRHFDDIRFETEEGRLDTTREIAAYAKEHGYDGVIFKNLRDNGGGFAYDIENSRKAGKPSTVTIVFSPDQVKDINNINPTSSKDIRYALNMDEDWATLENIIGEEKEEKAVDILAKGMEALKDKEVDVPKLRSLALKLRNEYGSSYNANKLAEDLRKAFAYMQTEDHVDYPTMMGILRDIARPVIEEAGEKVGEQEYKDFIDYFKGKKIKLTSTQKGDVIHHFGSYGAFRNAMMPITISDKGDITLDQIWEEMVQASGGMLDIDANEGDMPINLLDTLQAMRPYVRNDFGGDTEDLAKDLAMRIVEEYIEGESSKQMHKELTEYRNRLKKDYQERLKNLKGRANAEVLARNKRRAEQAKERQEVRDLKVKIKQNANKLYTWAAKPTEGKSIPHNMMVPVMQFLQAIDFVDPIVTVGEDGKYRIKLFDHVDYENGHRKFVYKDLVGDTREDVIKQFNEAIGRGQGTKDQRSWTGKMQGIRDIYNKVLNDTDLEDTSMDFLMQTLDAQGLAEEFDDLLSRHEGQADMNNLSSKELKLIDNIIKNIFHAVNQGNKAYSMNAEISNLAQDTIKESEGEFIKNRGYYASKGYDFLRIDNSTPKTFFKLLGNGAYKIYKAIRGGLNQEILDIKQASEFMEGIMKEVDKKAVQKWTGDKATVHEFNLTNGSIKMTDAQIMGLYLTLRRTGGRDRIKGGIKVGDIKQNGRTINQEVIHLTDGDIKQIESVLTPEQISLAQKMQKYMAVDCSAQGNETSMKLYGYKKFTDDTYYPWTVDKDTVATTNTSENIPMFNGLERSGFTKQLKEGAKNPLVINDVFDVFTDHVSQMASYHGYAASLKDTMRWMNYREQAPEDGGFVRYITNKNAINKLSGSKSGVGYVRDLILDINKARKSQYVGLENFMGNYKAASVGANLRVFLQQFTAYFRAMNVLKPKYLMSVNPATALKNGKRSRELSPISWWKSKGYYETNLGQPLKEIITGITSPVEKAKNVLMAPAGFADDVTWGFLYTAVEKEQRDLLKGQNTTPEQFRQAVNDRFDELVDSTQVVDSAIHRSAAMRSKDRLNILQTSFMAEPTKTYNMLMEAYIEDLRDGKKGKNKTMRRTARAMAVFLLVSIVNSVAKSLPDVMRHAGDDDDFWKEFIEYYKSNLLDEVNPFNLLPLVKDIAPEMFNVIEGFATGEYKSTYGSGNSRFDIDALTSIPKAAVDLIKYWKGNSNKTGYGAFMTLLRPVSQLTGIPMYNLTRDSVALYNSFFDNIETTLTSGSTAKNEKKKGFVSDVNKEKSEEVLDEGIVNAIENGVSIYDLKGAVQSEYKNKYFDAYSEGNTEEAQAIAERAARAYARMGLSDEDIDEIINGWQEETIAYSKLDKAIADGEGIEEEIKHVQEGKEDDKIIKHIMDRFSDTIAYEDTHETESDWRGNVEKALQAIDPTLTFDTAHEEALQKKAEKEAEKAEEAEKKGYKEEFFASVDNKNGSAGRKALDGLKAMGVEAKDAKAMVSNQYHKAWKEAKTPAEKQKAKSDWMSAYKLVCNYYGVDYNDLEKTWSDWEKKQ